MGIRRGIGGEAGTGVLATLPVVVVFLGLLAFAAQLLGGLYAASVVSAAAFDAARLAAADSGAGARHRGDAHARQLLGAMGASARLTWRELDTDVAPGPDALELRVVADSPLRLLPAVALPFDRVERAVTVRLERGP